MSHMDGPDKKRPRKAVLVTTLEKIYQCTVCLDLPMGKMCQCKEGHLICEDCFTTLPRSAVNMSLKCPTCKTDISTPPIRCRSAEEVMIKLVV